MMNKRILVPGAYGLIGSGIAHHLYQQGFEVIGIGRNAETAQRIMPSIEWIIDDLRFYTHTEKWEDVLQNIDIVINCSGALQDSPDDDLELIHHHMVGALATACSKQKTYLIQISSVGATPNATTRFLASKARGDDAIKKSGVNFTIFRPALVLAPTAYGGTALLRMLSAFPKIQPIAYPDAQIQTVSLFDLCTAVTIAINGKVPARSEYDLVETTSIPLQDIVAKIRLWLGFKPARFQMIIPDFMANFIAKMADMVAHFGWKSQLRSTAVSVLREGVQGNAKTWNALNLHPVSSIEQTLNARPATTEDRLSARIALLTPLIVVTLSAFWILSGVIGFLSLHEASNILIEIGWSQSLSKSSVIFWSVIDIILGLGILVRKFARLSCQAMIATSFLYLMASSIFVPQLWFDPLGPLVKILPAMILALVGRIVLENR